MRLISLTSNQECFHSVKFNRNGLSLIISRSTTDSLESTYNGVGKSLLLHLISFCLASDKYPAFEDKIPNWDFTLKVELVQEEFTLTRNTSYQNEIWVNDEKMSLKSVRDMLGENLLNLEQKYQFITYRAIQSRFLRTNKASYNSALKIAGERSDFAVLACNAFLLQLDLDLLFNKYHTRKDHQDHTKFLNSFEKDPGIAEFFTGSKDRTVHGEMTRLNKDIQELEFGVSNFSVAESYQKLEEEADLASSEKREASKSLHFLKTNIKNVEHSLSVYNHASNDRLNDIIGEMYELFKETAIKNIQDVSDFHDKLFNSRVIRLQKELKLLRRKLLEAETIHKAKKVKSDEAMALLGKSNAYEEFNAVSEKLSMLKRQMGKLNDFNEISTHTKKKIAEAETSLANQTEDALEYIEEYKERNLEVLTGFSELASRFYPESVATIEIDNNVGNNQLRFNIDVNIEHDSSDGINEVKIFCYDFNNLISSKAHNFTALCHDSRLFSDIDPRQKATLFSVANSVTMKLGKQYIATINEADLEQVASKLSSSDKVMLREAIVLELKDDKPSSKLLGIQIDMKYEKE